MASRPHHRCPSCNKARRRRKAGNPLAAIAFWREPHKGVLWVNNGNDQPNTTTQGGLDYDVQVPPAPPNYAPSQFYPIGHISCQRDLENFARLWICGLPALGNTYRVTLSWSNVIGSPAINLYNSVETNGGIGYLSNTNIAASQCLAQNVATAYGNVDFVGPDIAIASLSASSSFTFPANSFTNAGNQHFLLKVRELALVN